MPLDDLRDPRNEKNYELVCEYCGASWPHDKQIGAMVKEHFTPEHPGRRIAFSTRWKGLGPDPRKGSARSQRSGFEKLTRRRR